MQKVSDQISSSNEQIEFAAKVLGRSEQRHKVFDAIYFGKKKFKSVSEIALKTGLTEKQVLTHGKQLAKNHIVIQDKVNGSTGYKKDDFFQEHKNKIKTLSKDKKKLEAYPTKRKLSQTKVVTQVQFPSSVIKVERVTVDDIDSFSEVKKIESNGSLSKRFSEADFKNGVLSIIKEEGEFKDWGGEKNDLYTHRIKFKGKRVGVAFTFKGPGKSGTLVPGKMGKNGDQIQRLFESDADIFFVQYHDQIAQSISEQMYAIAVANSVARNKKIYYGTIDGVDSNRLVQAYSEKFTKSKSRK